MMEVCQMQRTLMDYTKSLFMEVTGSCHVYYKQRNCLFVCLILYGDGDLEKGILDGQFMQLQQLQDETNPRFVLEVVSLFFEDSQKLLHDLSSSL